MHLYVKENQMSSRKIISMPRSTLKCGVKEKEGELFAPFFLFFVFLFCFCLFDLHNISNRAYIDDADDNN